RSAVSLEISRKNVNAEGACPTRRQSVLRHFQFDVVLPLGRNNHHPGRLAWINHRRGKVRRSPWRGGSASTGAACWCAATANGHDGSSHLVSPRHGLIAERSCLGIDHE